MYAERLPPIEVRKTPGQNRLAKSNSCLYDNRDLSNKYLGDNVQKSEVPQNLMSPPIHRRTPMGNNYNYLNKSNNMSNAHNYLNYMIASRNNKVYSPYNPLKRYKSPLVHRSMMENPAPVEYFSPNRYNPQNYFGGLSTNEIRIKRINEITQPELYNKFNNEYQCYKEEQKKFLQYNFDLMKRQNQVKKYIDINPFNPLINENLGKSTLSHNTILNPVNNFTYNKYLESQLRKIEESNTMSKRPKPTDY